MRDTYANPVECPLMPYHLMEQVINCQQPTKGGLRTLHNYPHTSFKTVDHAKCLCDRHPDFILGQPIQLLQHTLNLAIAKKLLYEFL